MIYVSMQTQMVNTTGPITVVAKQGRAHYDSYTFQGIQLYSGRQNLVDEYPYQDTVSVLNVGVIIKQLQTLVFQCY
jgi:hypothetical protein